MIKLIIKENLRLKLYDLGLKDEDLISPVFVKGIYKECRNKNCMLYTSQLDKHYCNGCGGKKFRFHDERRRRGGILVH